MSPVTTHSDIPHEHFPSSNSLNHERQLAVSSERMTDLDIARIPSRNLSETTSHGLSTEGLNICSRNCQNQSPSNILNANNHFGKSYHDCFNLQLSTGNLHFFNETEI